MFDVRILLRLRLTEREDTMTTAAGSFSCHSAWRVSRTNLRPSGVFGIRELRDATRSPWEPPLDIHELPDAFLVVVEVPGLSRKSLEVTFDPGESVLTIAGYRDDLSPRDRVGTHQMEIRHGAFERRVKVLERVDADAIDARYAKGFIHVTLPKRKG
jgi:HSP20 family molecular chaperone IbpA